MIKSALSIQNKIDNKYTTSVDKFNNDFAVEALSNAGQRLGMSGDSVKYSSFTIKDLLSYLGKGSSIDSNKKYNCAIEYEQLNAYSNPTLVMSIIANSKRLDNSNKYQISLVDEASNDDINLFNKHIFAQDLTFDKCINNIEYFAEDSYLSVEENIFKTFLFGKKLGYREDDDFNVEIMYNEFDLSTNMLKRAIRMYHLFSLSNSNYYTVIDIQKRHDSVESKDFILKVFIMNDSSINVTEDQISKDDIKKSFSLKSIKNQIKEYKANRQNIDDFYNRYIDVFTSDSYFNYVNQSSTLYQIISGNSIVEQQSEPRQIQDVLNYDTVSNVILKQTNIFNSTIIGESLEELSQKIAYILTENGVKEDINEAITNVYRDKSFYASIIKNNQVSALSSDLIWNSTNNVITTLSSGYISNEIKNLLDSDYVGIDKRIEYINNDIIYLFPKLLKQYNELSFGTKTSLMKNVLLRIYEKVVETASYTDIQYGTLYIPLDYEFKYVTNSNNETEIFYSNNIFVNLTSLDESTDEQIASILSENDILIYDYNGETKIKTYIFSISYNTMYEDIINNIYVSYLFTLPYINAKNSWAINDVDTNILAKSISNSIQTFYIVYCKKNASNELISNFVNVNDENQLKVTEWVRSSFMTSNVNINYQFPKITQNNQDNFVNSTILFICDKSCVSDTKLPNDSLANIYTVFANPVKNDNDTWIYKPIVLDSFNNVNLDLTQVINQSELIAKIANSMSNEYKTSNMLLINSRKDDGDVRDHDSTYLYNNVLMMTVQTASEFIEDLFITALPETDYNNNLNFVLGFVNKNEDVSYKLQNNPENKTYYIGDTSSENEPTNNKLKSVTRPLQYTGSKAIMGEEQEMFYKNIEYFLKLTYKKSVDNINFDVYDDAGTFIQQISETQYETIQKFSELQQVPGEIKTVEIGRENTEVIWAGDYYPAFDVPLLNLKEMLVSNFNLLHRLNILSIGADGSIYNAYLGTNYRKSNDYDCLILTTDYQNINLGKANLIDPNIATNLNTFKTFEVKFNNIVMNTNSLQRKYVNRPELTTESLRIMGQPKVGDNGGVQRFIYENNTWTFDFNHQYNDPNYYVFNNAIYEVKSNNHQAYLINWNEVLKKYNTSNATIRINGVASLQIDTTKTTNNAHGNNSKLLEINGKYLSILDKIININETDCISLFNVEITCYTIQTQTYIDLYIPEDCMYTINIKETANV